VSKTKKQIRLGYGSEMRHYQMPLFKFDPDLPAIGAPKQLMTKPIDAFQKQISQALTKAATGPAFSKTRSILAGIGLFLPEAGKAGTHEAVSQFMGEVTRMKKHPLARAERIVSGLLTLGTPESMKTVRRILPDVPESILENIRHVRTRLGETGARSTVEALIAANMSKVPMTSATSYDLRSIDS